MKPRPQLTRHQKLFGAILHSQTSFMRYFWRGEINLPPSTRQKLFWNDQSRRVLLATGRKTGKTVYIEARMVRKALLYRAKKLVMHIEAPVSERMFVTPGENQLNPVRDRLISKIDNNPLFRLVMASYNKNEGTIRFETGVVWYLRIEGSDGTDRNMVGLRADEVLGDEMALGNATCHASRKQSALPGCEFAYCGVPNGVRSTPFFKLDQTKEGLRWSRHKCSTFVNPLYWSEETRQDLIDEYGRGSQDFITQVMGGWGEELFSSFPPGSLAIDQRLPYRIVHLEGRDIPYEYDAVMMTRMAARLALPRPEGVYQYVIGMDYGQLQDPTQLGVAYRMSAEEMTWKMMCRVQVEGATTQAQARLLRVIAWILGEKRIAKACLDQQHAGIAVATELLELPDMGRFWSRALMDLNSGGTVELEVRPRKKKGEEQEEQETVKPKVVKKVRRKQWVTQLLQASLMAAKANLDAQVRLWLGKDEDLEQELIDTRERKTEAGNIIYIARDAGHHRPVDHCTDMLRCILAAAVEAQDSTGEEDDDEEWCEAVGPTQEPLFGKKGSFKPPWQRPKARRNPLVSGF